MPRLIIAMPKELNNLEPILSDTLPAKGERIAMVIGVRPRIIPAFMGAKFLTLIR